MTTSAPHLTMNIIIGRTTSGTPASRFIISSILTSQCGYLNRLAGEGWVDTLKDLIVGEMQVACTLARERKCRRPYDRLPLYTISQAMMTLAGRHVINALYVSK